MACSRCGLDAQKPPAAEPPEVQLGGCPCAAQQLWISFHFHWKTLSKNDWVWGEQSCAL